MLPCPEPLAGTFEAWALELIGCTDLARKRTSAVPDPACESSWEASPPARRVAAPGRPRGLRIETRSPRTPRPGALARPEVRARLVHVFLHHELQAAELFAWALLAFPDTPREFRAGLVRLAQDELRHLELYAAYLDRLGHAHGDFPVRDWFWERVPSCADATAFVALFGLGLEGANLEHSERFAAAFRAAGDEEGAALLERIEREEIAHVAFAVRWFERFAGSLDYDRWAAALPAPLSPALFRGHPLNRAARLRAGQDESFLARLADEPPTNAARPLSARRAPRAPRR